MQRIGIGIFGFGVVGGGVVEVLRREGEELARRTGIELQLKAVVSLPPYRTTEVLGASLGPDPRAILDDPEIRIVLLLVGGTGAAKDLALASIRAGKHLVTSNKALIAEHGDELFAAARAAGVSIAFEAAVAGGIPIIGALRDGLCANRILSITGILNGTTNYILTMMEQQGWSYEQALREAQRLGYAEADPTLDVSGMDTAHKLAILARIAFQVRVPVGRLRVEGIERVSARDIASAARMRCRIKLLARAQAQGDTIDLHVAPTLVPLEHPLASVHLNYNGVYIESSNAGPQLFTGQGAGALPTASAVLADTIDVALGRSVPTFQAFGFVQSPTPWQCIDEREERTASFARFITADRPGVLATIAQILSRRGISIRSIHQDDPIDGRAAIELVTYPTRGGDFLDAIAEIDASGCTLQPTVSYRRLSG